MHMGEFSKTISSAGPPYREKREVPRFTFIACVDITEPTTEMHMSGRISEISRKGCYVDVLNTLPVGTPIRLCISRDTGTFATLGKIIYAQEGMGMGVAFDATTPDQLQILDSWLSELTL
jgi:hypothetical protein